MKLFAVRKFKGLTTSTMSMELRPSHKQLAALAVSRAVPAIVFGFMDNFIMILGGDAIEVREE